MKLTFFSALFATAVTAVNLSTMSSDQLAEVDEAYNELEYYNDFEYVQEAAMDPTSDAKAAAA